MQKKLETHFRDMQDIEFTIQKDKLWLLQTRNGKRTMRAAVRIAVDMVNEGVISKDEAVMRVDAGRLSELFLPRLDPSDAKNAEDQGKLLAQGLGASPGYAAGEIVFTADEAERLAGQGKEVILVRRETSPEDIHGMKAARGILTATRRDDVARSRRGAWHGQVLRRRVQLTRRGLPDANGHGASQDRISWS